MNIGIVGYGIVGTAIYRFFSPNHTVTVFDKYQATHASPDIRDQINSSDLTFIAVPTPTASDGWHCDLTEIYDVFEWLTTPACIKSTIPPGTISELSQRRHSPVVFSPEYLGERPGHQWSSLDACGFVIIGGQEECLNLVELAYRISNESLRIYRTSAEVAELCKYMENAFLATKVSFVNQFYDIAHALNVDFDSLINVWTRDPRIGNSHCAVTAERGFGGKCLPKDIRALIAAVHGATRTDFLEAIVAFNDRIRTCAAVAYANLPAPQQYGGAVTVTTSSPVTHREQPESFTGPGSRGHVRLGLMHS